jgi:ribokinase
MGKRHGAKIILNPAPARPLDHNLLNQIDYLVPNEQELYMLTGKQLIGPALTSFQSIGAACLIVTLGEDGVLVQEGMQATRLEAHQVRAIDTTAAGDAFVGAFAVALTQGLSTLEAAEWGNAAGALAVTAAGAQPSLPRRADLEQFLKKHPARFREV